MNNTENTELFDKYLQGNLNEKDKHDFEERLRHEKVFSADFELHKSIVQGVKDYAMKKKLERFDNEIPEPNFNFMWGKKNLGIAAAILVLITVGFFMLREQNTKEDLFAENFEPLQNEIIEFTRGDSIPAKFKHLATKEYRAFFLAMKAYSQKKYYDADSLFSLLNKESVTSEMALYIGITQLALSKDGFAIESFEQALKSNENHIQEHSKWYLSLSYLNSGNLEESKKWLKQLEYSKIYAKKSKEISQKIEK